MFNEILTTYPLVSTIIVGLLAIVLANVFLALMPLVGGRDSFFPRN